MPTPRRHLMYLANDADGTVVTPPKSHHRQPRPDSIERCGRCGCRLARDQKEHYCSPCQRVQNDVPSIVSVFLEERP